MSKSKEIAVAQPQPQRALSVFSSEDAFTSAQRMCRALVSSNLVPESYRGEQGMGNALVALDMSNRMGIPPLMVMQNLDIIEGRPSWKSQFIIGALNSCGLFSPIRFRVEDHGDQEVEKIEWRGPKGNRERIVKKVKVRNKTCVAYAVEKATGEVLEGPEVSIEMAVAEGWYYRPGSKWLTMPDLMLRYRAAAFFGRLYAPHILNGMPAVEEAYDMADDYAAMPGEIVDVEPEPIEDAEPEEKPAGRPKGVHAAMKAAKTADAKAEAPAAEPHPEPEPEAASADEPADDGAPFGDPDDDDDGYAPA